MSTKNAAKLFFPFSPFVTITVGYCTPGSSDCVDIYRHVEHYGRYTAMSCTNASSEERLLLEKVSYVVARLGQSLPKTASLGIVTLEAGKDGR